MHKVMTARRAHKQSKVLVYVVKLFLASLRIAEYEERDDVDAMLRCWATVNGVYACNIGRIVIVIVPTKGGA